MRKENINSTTFAIMLLCLICTESSVLQRRYAGVSGGSTPGTKFWELSMRLTPHSELRNCASEARLRLHEAWVFLLSPSTISASSSSLRISEFVLLPSPFLATDAVVWLCTSNIFLIISRRSATCPSMEDIRSSTVVLIWFISPSSRSSKASTFLAAIALGFENSEFVFQKSAISRRRNFLKSAFHRSQNLL
ncbi:hypothetical protein M5K25_013930 [Dendrobium thyrsiflorum]|uniref:Secreted protein n=1 Tax=Dendrobium thyrsiflorum TaxID=117978 RepID=A0ABD0V1H8_DENTH